MPREWPAWAPQLEKPACVRLGLHTRLLLSEAPRDVAWAHFPAVGVSLPVDVAAAPSIEAHTRVYGGLVSVVAWSAVPNVACPGTIVRFKHGLGRVLVVRGDSLVLQVRPPRAAARARTRRRPQRLVRVSSLSLASRAQLGYAAAAALDNVLVLQAHDAARWTEWTDCVTPARCVFGTVGALERVFGGGPGNTAGAFPIPLCCFASDSVGRLSLLTARDLAALDLAAAIAIRSPGWARAMADAEATAFDELALAPRLPAAPPPLEGLPLLVWHDLARLLRVAERYDETRLCVLADVATCGV